MARNAVAAVENENSEPKYGYKDDGTPRLRPARTGEKRVAKPFHVLFRVTDENGHPVTGAKLEVVYIGKSPEKVLELHRQQRDLEYTTISPSGAEGE